MKTKDKIILASLELFNAQGERNVTTNHIAAHLGISPGNLYYHYRNKSDIIYKIFEQYELLVDHYLQLPVGRELTLEDLVFYLESVFDGLWSYRFLHRDLEYLMDCDPRLRADYRAFTLRCLGGIKSILQGLQESRIVGPIEPNYMEMMALNVWLVVTNWMAYLKTAFTGQGDDAINKDMLKQGVAQVLALCMPYLEVEYQPEVDRLRLKYQPGGTLPHEQQARIAAG